MKNLQKVISIYEIADYRKNHNNFWFDSSDETKNLNDVTAFVLGLLATKSKKCDYCDVAYVHDVMLHLLHLNYSEGIYIDNFAITKHCKTIKGRYALEDDGWRQSFDNFLSDLGDDEEDE